MSDIKQQYETFPYDSFPFAQTHPVHLATRARLHGLTPADPRKCRYLEIGCSNARNLIDIACGFPESEFVGIDLAENAIAEGQKVVDRLGLKNVQLIAGDLTHYPLDDAPFDYMVSHGLYSWIPTPVREYLWLMHQKLLAPQGIMYLSYNVYPGCYLRRMLREMMLFHVHQYESPREKVGQASAFLRFLNDALASQKDVGLDARKEIDELLHHRRDSSIYHDDLSPINEPMYFHQVVAKANQFQLQFLSEATFLDSTSIYFPEPIQQHLQNIETTSYLMKEQYLDFLKLRRFRSSLFCRHGIKIDHHIANDRLVTMFFSSNARYEGELKWDKETALRIVSPNSATISLNHPLSKAAMYSMMQTFPRYWSVAELRTHAEELLKNQGVLAEDEQELHRTLQTCYEVGLLDAKCIKPNVASQLPSRPKISANMRDQLSRGETVLTNQLHIPVEFDKYMIDFLLLCDGTRTRRELIDAPITLPDLENFSHEEKLERMLNKLITLAIFEAE